MSIIDGAELTVPDADSMFASALAAERGRLAADRSHHETEAELRVVSAVEKLRKDVVRTQVPEADESMRVQVCMHAPVAVLFYLFFCLFFGAPVPRSRDFASRCRGANPRDMHAR